jgi:hypothetical protein
VAGPTTYLDFDVVISRRGDRLDVRLLDSPAGETGSVLSLLPESVLTGPADGGAGARALRPVRATAEGTEPTAVGTALFTALFHGPVHVAYGESRYRASQVGAGLRLRLRFAAGTEALPWELLYDPQAGSFLALNPLTPVIRCTETATRDLVAPVDDQLRVLVAVSSPQGTSPVDALREQTAVRALLEPLMLGSAVVIEVLEDASLEGIRRMLTEREFHVFHYIGHGTVSADGKSAVVLTDAAGALSVRSCDDLAFVLAAAASLRLVVLNSCHGSVSSPTDPFAGAGATLVRAGIPAVVAMRATISNDAAVTFASGLYRELADAAPIERAVSVARTSLAASDSAASREWPTVALHLGSSLASGLTASPLPRLDNDVEFTVARTHRLTAEEWTPMLVFAHHGDAFVAADGQLVDQAKQVRELITSFFEGAVDVRTTSQESSLSLPRGAELVVEPDLPGFVECNPPVARIVWRGDIAEARFLLRPRFFAAGLTVEGWVRVFCGPVVVGETKVEFAVETGEPTGPDTARHEPIRRYRQIFPCFAPEDAEVVGGIVAVAEALGDRYTERVVTAQREGAPTAWLLDVISEADAFQLFWSRHSMVSADCRQQWERALGTARDGFILPLYWEDPFPRAAGLPPPALEGLRFVRLPTIGAVSPTPATPPGAAQPSAPQPLPPPYATAPSAPTASAPAPSAPAPSAPAPSAPAPRRRRRLAAGVGMSLAGIVSALVATALVGAGQTAGPSPGGGDAATSIVTLVLIVLAIVFGTVGINLVMRARRRR